MKLLFDANLSPKLCDLLSDLFPDSNHVYLLGLGQASDSEIWEFARQNDFILATKDADFSDMAAVEGFPPKLIWIQLGNCTTSQIQNLLCLHHDVIQEMNDNPNIGILELS